MRQIFNGKNPLWEKLGIKGKASQKKKKKILTLNKFIMIDVVCNKWATKMWS